MDISSEAKYLNTFSNSKYPAKIGTKLGNEADLSTAMSYLRKCVDVELNLPLDTDWHSKAFSKVLSPILAKLFNGFKHPIVSLMRVSMNWKLKAKMDVSYDVYNDNFGSHLGQFQREWGISGASSWRVFETIAMFNDEPVLYEDIQGIGCVRGVAQAINCDLIKYIKNQDLIDLVATDGTENYQYFAKSIITIYQAANKLPITGTFDESQAVPYDESKYSITDPIQFAFMLRGYTSQVGWHSYQNYHDDIMAFQRSIGDKVDSSRITPHELAMLFDANSAKINNLYSTLTILWSIKRYLQKKVKKSLDDAYNRDIDLGSGVYVGPNGEIVTTQIGLYQNRVAAQLIGFDFDDSDEKHDLQTTDTKIDFKCKNGVITVNSSDPKYHDFESSFTTHIGSFLTALKISDSQGSCSIGFDPTTLQITVTYCVQISKILHTEPTMTSVLKIVLGFSLNDFFNKTVKATQPDLYNETQTMSEKLLMSLGLKLRVDIESFTIALLGTMLITVCASFGSTLLVKLGSVFEFGL